MSTTATHRLRHALLVALATLSIGNVAHADEALVFVMPGATIAPLSITDSQTSYAVGGELSLAFLGPVENGWTGGYADALYDGSRGWRISVGPEWGIRLGQGEYSPGFGLDGGVAFSTTGLVGPTIRAMLAMAVVGLYARGGHLFGDGDYSFFEAGIYLKIPLPVGSY